MKVESILDLPADVLLRVLNEVDLLQQGPAVLTCRRFKELLYENTLRSTLDLSREPYRINVNDEAFVQLLNRHPNLQDLDITYCFRLTRASLSLIKSKASTLRRLAMGWNNRVVPQLLKDIISGLPDPTKAQSVGPFSAVQEKTGCPQLEHLDLRGCWNLDDSDLKAIALYCPALKSANFDYCAFSEPALSGFLSVMGAKLEELSIWWTSDEERPPGCTLPPRYSRVAFPPHLKVYSEHSPPTTFSYVSNISFTQQLETAKRQAQAEDKRILLQVALNSLPGGDTFTSRLHNFFTTNREIAAKLNESYVYLIVDNDIVEHNALLARGIRSITEFPTLFVLDKDGSMLVGKGTGDLEENCPSGCCYNPHKIFHFLRRWKPGAVLPPANMLPDLREMTSQAPINPLYSFTSFGDLTNVMPAQRDDDAY